MDPRAIFHSRMHELLAGFEDGALVVWPGSDPIPADRLPAAGGLAGASSSPHGLIIDEAASALLLPWRLRGRTFSLVFNYNTFFLGLAAALVARWRHVPVVFDLADDLAETVGRFVPHRFQGIARVLARVLIRINILLADCVTLTTDTLAARYAAPARRRQIVPNGVDSRRFSDLPAAPGVGPRPVRLVYVGALREWVDFSPVLEAMKSLAADGLPCELLIAGGGHAESVIRQRASALGVEPQVRYLGPVPYERVPGILRDADICLIPFDSSPISEAAFPLKLLEYMASRRPVIASPLPAVRNVAGDLVRYASTGAEYAQAIRAIRDDGPSPAELDAGAQRVRDAYSWDAARAALREAVRQVR